MKLSVVIPAHNEEGCIEETVRKVHEKLAAEKIPHELIVVNDNSRDKTAEILARLATEISELKVIFNAAPNGFGRAVRRGLDSFTGDAVAVFMADLSDTPEDLVRFYRVMIEKNVSCVFGTRWSQGGRVVDYPWFKLIINRMVNRLIQILFQFRYNDASNAFKLYRKEVIQGVQPLISPHFNLTVEIPLKAIIRGYSYTVVPNIWINRKTGESKLNIREMGSRYLFIIILCFIEKWLTSDDYKVRR